MKKIHHLLIVLVFAVSHAAAQEPANGDARIFTIASLLTECDEAGAALAAPATQSIPGGAKFNIYKQAGDNYIIVLWKWGVTPSFFTSATQNALNPAQLQVAQYGQETNEQKLMRLNFRKDGTRRYFLLPKADLPAISKALYPRWSPTLGTLSYLFKWRPSTGVLENAFNINITGGWRVLLNPANPNHSIAFTGGVGVTTISRSTDADTSAKAAPGGGITFSGNMVYVWDRLQIGLSSGLDVPVGESAAAWKYKGKPWISFGIGINIFSEDKPSQASGTQE